MTGPLGGERGQARRLWPGAFACLCLGLLLCACLAAFAPWAAAADEVDGNVDAAETALPDGAVDAEGAAGAPDEEGASDSAADRDAAEGAAGASDTEGSSPRDAELPVAQRAQDAIGACIAGLFAGWGVDGPADFYGSDMLMLGDGACEWMAFDVYRAGATNGADAFIERMEARITEAYAGAERGLDAYSPTTWSRAAIVVGTMGADPQAFAENADGQPANLLADGLYNWSYTDDLADQGCNALIYSLQAIDALQVAVPADSKYSTEDVLHGILDCQADDGSFALSPGSRTGSVDLTGMALAALAPYRDLPQVADAVDAAVEYLAAQQADNGGFAAEGQATSESCAMVVIGLSACGIDASTDGRFAKQGGTPVDALLRFQKPDGTFAHLAGDLADAAVRDLPTEQALRALLAFAELQQGGDGNVYTSDIALDLWQVRVDDGGLDGSFDGAGAGAGETPGASFPPIEAFVPYLASIAIGAAIGAVLVVAIWFFRRIRRKARR